MTIFLARGNRATCKFQFLYSLVLFTIREDSQIDFARPSVYLGQTHLGTPFQVPAWVRKFSLGSTGDQIFSLIIIQSLFVQQKFEH